MPDDDAYDAEELDWYALSADLSNFTPDASGSLSFRFDGIVRENQGWPEGNNPAPSGTQGEPSVYMVYSLEPGPPVSAGRTNYFEGIAHTFGPEGPAWYSVRILGHVQSGADIGALLKVFTQVRSHLADLVEAADLAGTPLRLTYLPDLARSYAVGILEGGEYYLRELRIPCVRA